MLQQTMFTSANRFALVGAILLAGCSSGDFPSGLSGQIIRGGGVGLALTVSDGSGVESVRYDISREGNSIRTGTLAVGSDGRVTGTIAGLDAGEGYRVDFEVPRTHPTEGPLDPCRGSAAFAVEDEQTTPVSVLLQCDETVTHGNVIIRGTLNYCPTISCASATPDTQVVGRSVELDVSAVDKDGDSLTFSWSEGAVFSEETVFASGSHVTFTCESPGTFYVNARVCDRGPQGCQVTLAMPLAVRCIEAEVNRPDCGS